MPRKNLTQKQLYDAWTRNIKRARSGRRAMESKWRRWYNIVDDAMWGRGHLADGSHAIQVNVLHSILQGVIPAITFGEGKVESRAINNEDIYRAAIYEGIGRHHVRKSGLQDQFLSTVFDALVLGDGLTKVGYHTLPLLGEPQWNSGIASEQGPRPFTTYGMNMPMFEYLPDFAASQWNRQRFFIHELDKHIDEVKENPLYEKKQVAKIKPSRRSEDIFYIGEIDKEDKKKDYVALQEVHDLVEAKVYILAENQGTDGFLYQDVEQFGMIPVERLSFFPRPMNVFGKGITQSIEKHMVSLSKMHTYMENRVKKESLIKMLINIAGMKPEARKQLENSNDAVIPITGDPQNMVEVVNYGAAASNFVFERAMSIKKGEIREIAGAGRQQMGIHETGVRTATESQNLQVNADSVNAWRSKRFNDFAARVIEKMIFITTVTQTPEAIAKMVGYPVHLVIPWLEPYDPSRYITTYGGAALQDQAERREKFMAFMQLFGQALNPAMAIQIAADVFDIEYTDKLLVPGLGLGGAVGGQGQLAGGGGEPASAGFRPEESQGQTNQPGGF